MDKFLYSLRLDGFAGAALDQASAEEAGGVNFIKAGALAFALFGLSLPAAAEYVAPKESTIRIEELAAACAQYNKRDPICDAIVQLKQVGDDAVEAIKTFVNLGPAEYAVLTVANAVYTQRIRVRSHVPYLPKWNSTLDLQPDQTTLTFETSL